MKYIFVISIAVQLLVSCKSTKVITSNALKQVIERKYELVSSSLKVGDATPVINLHSEQAVQFLPDGTEISGLPALREFYFNYAKTKPFISSKPISIEMLSNSLALEVGIFSSTSSTGKQNKGKYIIIWKKINDDWKILKAIDQAKL